MALRKSIYKTFIHRVSFRQGYALGRREVVAVSSEPFRPPNLPEGKLCCDNFISTATDVQREMRGEFR